MIFVTVGAQMPFDRMIRTVDEWAGQRHRIDVFAQIGPTRFRPENIQFSDFINPGQFYENLERADTIVAHAGMGTIISAVERRKPILVMPRRSELGETRNDHQVATARQFEALKFVEVAMDESVLFHKLDALDQVRVPELPSRHASPHCATCPFAANPDLCAERAAAAACPHLLEAMRAFLADELPDIGRYAISADMHAV
jgi:UDP-N-acetylglucosamine transferase subunit ALG13